MRFLEIRMVERDFLSAGTEPKEQRENQLPVKRYSKLRSQRHQILKPSIA